MSEEQITLEQTEKELQDNFYINVLGINPTMELYTDGMYNGILFENKVNINRLDSVLMQSIKYLSGIRNRGKLLPYYIINTDFTDKKSYVYKSEDYLKEIEKVYFGAFSQNNNNPNLTPRSIDSLDWGDNREDRIKLQRYVAEVEKKPKWTKYHVDFHNILGLAKEYYNMNPSKDMLLDVEDGELRKPNLLKDRIIPYKKDDNNAFSSIMDCLNTKLQQKELGAFFTPPKYAEISQKMLLDYIKEIEAKNKDYIVIDRAAGCGALFDGLPDEVLKHCVLSTLEPNEYLILKEKFGDKALVVVPPMDALKYDIIPAEIDNDGNIINDVIREKIEDKNTVVIMYENPPYSEVAGGTIYDNTKRNAWKQSFVCNEMKKEHKGVATNDLTNLFIWSAFKYYLRDEDDTYILYSPIKYWKSLGIVNKNYKKAFIVNRREFHATDGAIALIQWMNKDSDIEEIDAKVFEKNIDIKIRKVHKLMSEAYDKRKFEDDTLEGIICEANGLEFNKNGRQIRVKSIYNFNIVGYIVSAGNDIDIKHIYLTRQGISYGNGFFLRNDNYISKLPLFVTSIPNDTTNKWYNRGLLNKTLDGGDSYLKDENFLKKCFIYTCLSFNNKCRSLNGSDGRLYRNELCFDKNTIASKDLVNFKTTKEEQNLIDLYYDILEEIKDKKEYNSKYSYGPFQIREEINTKREERYLKPNGYEVVKKVYNYKELNGQLLRLRDLLREYFNRNIIDDLFKYELIK